MRSIKGLILKDLLNLSHYKTSLVILVIAMILIATSQQGFTLYIPIMLITMFGMIALSTFSYDEMAKSDKYVLSLPSNKKEIVKSKYIVVISFTILAAILSIIISYVISVYVYKQTPELMKILIPVFGGMFGIGLVTSIQIPSIYKWRAERGRVQMFIMIIILISLISAIIYFVTKNIGIDVNAVGKIFNNFGIPILTLVTIIMYVISYKVSCKIYSKKDL